MLKKLKRHILGFIKRKPQLLRAARILYHSGDSSRLVYTCRNWTANKYIRYALKVLMFPVYIFKYFHIRDVPGREGLAFVLIAKNEAPYIEEWLNFHRKQGVTHFIIYDNESTDNFREILTPYIDSGLVTYNTIKGKMRQLDAYNMAVHDYGRKFKYMAFIDADEFVFVRKNTYTGGGMT
ncbi:MAG: glycosyltransferase family 2 protein [Synergistaceae bacterium]|nr:glycosyltransferase family 2 protein [Synergistaceae bacterium]